MKPQKLLLLLFLAVISCNSDESSSPGINSKQKVQQLLNAAAPSMFPGLSVSVIAPEESYTIVSGKSKLPSTHMSSSTIHYMQSIAKTFTAVATLKLKEEGKINIDAPITAYLPTQVSGMLPNANAITIRHLLNMTSGIADYTDNPEFIADVQTGTLPLSSMQILSYIANEPAHFAPGTATEYCNANYHLLALIIDNVTDGGHSNYITSHIIEQAGLAHTYYLPGSVLTEAPTGTAASYLYQNGTFTDMSTLQFGIVKSLIGDDGIVASTQDIARFYNKLLNEKSIVSQESLNTMMTRGINSGIWYGMGLTLYESPAGISGYGHPGSGAGAAAEAAYFPDKGITIVLSTNTGTLFDPVKEEQFSNLWTQIMSIIIDGK